MHVELWAEVRHTNHEQGTFFAILAHWHQCTTSVLHLSFCCYFFPYCYIYHYQDNITIFLHSSKSIGLSTVHEFTYRYQQDGDYSCCRYCYCYCCNCNMNYLLLCCLHAECVWQDMTMHLTKPWVKQVFVYTTKMIMVVVMFTLSDIYCSLYHYYINCSLYVDLYHQILLYYRLY